MKKTAMLLMSAVVLVFINQHLSAESPTPIVSQNIPLEVTIVSSDGKPVPDAEVWICSIETPWSDGPAEVLSAGRSEADGRFKGNATAYTDIPHHTYVAIARSAKDGVGVTSINGFQGQIPPPGKIVLTPASSAKIRMLKPDGSPAAGVTLRVQDICDAHPSMGGMFSTVPALPDGLWQAKTNAEGRCEITSLPSQTRIYFKHDALPYAQQLGRQDPLNKWVKVGSDETTQTLAQAGTVHGQIVTPDGTPLSGAQIKILDDSRPYVTSYKDSVFTDKQGRFTFAQVPPSDYNISVNVARADRDTWIGRPDIKVSVKADETSELGKIPVSKVAIVTMRILNHETGEKMLPPITNRLTAGSHTLYYRNYGPIPSGFEPVDGKDGVPVTVKEGERLTVDYKLAPVEKTRLITGTLFDPTGKPASFANVTLFALESRERWPTSISADAEGRYTLVTQKNATKFLIFGWNKDGDVSELIPVTADSEVDLHIKQDGFASVSGQVLDDHGKPVTDANLQWHTSNNSIGPIFAIPVLTTTDKEGRYAFPRLWNGLTYEITCRTEGFGSAFQNDITPAKGQALTVNFTLASPTKTLAGVVVDSAGNLMANVLVSGSGKGQGDLKTKTDAQGRFRFEKVVSGNVSLWAMLLTDDIHVETSMKATAGQQDVRIVLPDGKESIKGVVVDEAGKPQPHASIWSNGRTVKGDADGQFALKGLVGGWYNIDFTVNDSKRGERAKRFRFKTGMHDLRVVMPDKQPAEEIYLEEAPNMIGKDAPALSISSWIQGEPLSAKPNGKVRIIDFWNTECAPCVATFPKIQTFFDENPSLDIEFIALHAPNPELEVQEFLQKRPQLKFPVAISAQDVNNSLNYGVRGNPAYIVVNQAGKIISHGHDWKAATDAALAALKQP